MTVTKQIDKDDDGDKGGKRHYFFFLLLLIIIPEQFISRRWLLGRHHGDALWREREGVGERASPLLDSQHVPQTSQLHLLHGG